MAKSVHNISTKLINILLTSSHIVRSSVAFSASAGANNKLFYSTIRQDHCEIGAMKFLNQEEAARLDQELFTDHQYSLDQLMELAGLACAQAVTKQYPSARFSRPLVVCGPGNNGGDGLVAARHLRMFGYSPQVVYPKRSKNEHMVRLAHQLSGLDIPVFDQLPENFGETSDFIVDAIFGFSYKPPIREPFGSILSELNKSGLPIASVDIPSGWLVDTGPPPAGSNAEHLRPDMLVSLTAPKLCAQHFTGTHYLGGRFLPPKMALKYGLQLPPFAGSDCVVLL